MQQLIKLPGMKDMHDELSELAERHQLMDNHGSDWDGVEITENSRTQQLKQWSNNIKYDTKEMDREIYIPYQCAMESILDDSFDTFSFAEQLLLGLVGVGVRKLGYKRKEYAPLIRAYAIRVELKRRGEDYGYVTPLHQRPSNRHIFTALEKLKVLTHPEAVGNEKYYEIRQFPSDLKKQIIYPSFNEVLPSLMKYLKDKKIQLTIGTDFHFALPCAIRDVDFIKAELDQLPVKEDVNGKVIYTVGNAFTLTFV